MIGFFWGSFGEAGLHPLCSRSVLPQGILSRLASTPCGLRACLSPQAGKISRETAESLYHKCAKNVKHHVDNLSFLCKAEQAKTMEEHIAENEKKLKLLLRPLKNIPELDEMEEQFAVLMARRRMLVVEGPSGCGKTEMVKAYGRRITGRDDAVLEINCARTPEPNFRELLWLIHVVALLDEISVQAVLDQRRVLQGPNVRLNLGCSATNAYAYSVYTYGLRICICSNTWSEQVAALKYEGDREWIRKNTIHLKVPTGETLFEAPPSLEAPEDAAQAEDAAQESAGAAALQDDRDVMGITP